MILKMAISIRNWHFEQPVTERGMIVFWFFGSYRWRYHHRWGHLLLRFLLLVIFALIIIIFGNFQMWH